MNKKFPKIQMPEGLPRGRCGSFDLTGTLLFFEHLQGRVRTGPGKPGKSWNFIVTFSRTGKSWKKATGPGKLWKFVKLS